MVDAPRPLRVLAVDDWLDTADSLEALLRLWGHDVRVANDGDTALRIASEFRPDAVLLDVALGRGLDGYEVARRLRADPLLGRVLLICVSGYGMAVDREMARAAGFDHHLIKPADPDELRRLLAHRGSRHDG